MLIDTRDVVEANLISEVGRHGHFVGCVEGAGSIAAPLYGLVGKAQVGETGQVRGLESQLPESGEIQFAVAHADAGGEGECEADGLAHIRAAQLRDDGSVRKFHHRMDDGFGMHYDLYVLGRHIEEESIVTFEPIFQFGCLSASAAVAPEILFLSQVRNGPPDAVRWIFSTVLP